jgi:hypothetical protein
MADPQVNADMGLPPPSVDPAVGDLALTIPARRDTSSSDGSDKYSPIPTGLWTIDFHGSCPRCRHHHRSVKVKVKNTKGDSSQLSYVQCERCKEKWAAFGGRNTTRISLLSTTTNDPDPVAEEVRHSLIKIVRSATAIASLGGIPELATQVPPHQSSVESPTRDEPRPSTHWPRSDTPPFAIVNHQQRDGSSSPVDNPHTARSVKQSRAFSLFSKVRGKVVTRYHQLRQDYKQHPSRCNKEQVSTRKLEKSPVRAPMPQESPNVLSDPQISFATQPTRDTDHAVAPELTVNISESSKTKAAADEYVRSLDTRELDSLNEPGCASWMREKYTTFKTRDGETPLSLSEIHHISIPVEEAPPEFARPINRRSADVRGAGGGHIEGLESIEADTWPRSISISETTRTSETVTAYDAGAGGGHIEGLEGIEVYTWPHPISVSETTWTSGAVTACDSSV